MTRTKCFLLALALTGPGCLNLTHLEEPPAKTPPVQVTVTPPPPIITPDEVNEANAVEKAQALAHELDFADHEHSAAPAKMSATNP